MTGTSSQECFVFIFILCFDLFFVLYLFTSGVWLFSGRRGSQRVRAGPRGNEEMLRLVRPENRLNSYMKVMLHETIPLIFQI